jgi:hypothetical protein
VDKNNNLVLYHVKEICIKYNDIGGLKVKAWKKGILQTLILKKEWLY